MSTTSVSTIRVELGARSYPIEICPDLGQLAAAIRGAVPARAAVVTSHRLLELYGHNLKRALRDAGLDLPDEDMIAVDDGEHAKHLGTVSQVLDALVTRRHTRKSTVIAFGGGVIGDLAGFAASIFLRGVDYIQVPTTVVAMVDSAVGGKTGVDHPQGKNLIGSFHQPVLVAVHPDFLDTLDDHNRRGGLAEVIKYGCIRDAAFFQWLEQEGVQAFLGLHPEAVAKAVLRSCEVKASIVSEDEFESQNGVRAHLNFGHTFGHGIEAVVLRNQLAGTEAGPVGRLKAWWSREQVHGQCVAVGMGCAMDLGVRLRTVDQADVLRLERLLMACGLPTRIPPGISPEQVLQAMATDKKALGGKLRFIVPMGIGRVETRAGIESDLVLAVLQGRTDDTRA